MVERRQNDNPHVTIMNVVMELNTHVWTNERQGALIKYLENNEFLWSDANKDKFRDVATQLAKEWLAAYKPPKKKEIEVEIYLNGEVDGATVKLLVDEAETLLALWKEAQETFLRDMEEEYYWEKFDPWLKEKATDIYYKIMRDFNDDYLERAGCLDSGSKDSPEISFDIDGPYLNEFNEIVINQIFPPAE